MAAFTAFYDANVLYPAELRNLLMHLAPIGLFRAKWSADVHLEGARILMDRHAADALVTGYEELIPALQLPDPDDRHVLAAAIHSHADVIVTMNLRDFPSRIIGSFGIEAQHPDEFVLHILDLAPAAVVAAAQNHRQSLRNPPRTVGEYLETLKRQGLTRTVFVLREYAL